MRSYPFRFPVTLALEPRSRQLLSIPLREIRTGLGGAEQRGKKKEGALFRAFITQCTFAGFVREYWSRIAGMKLLPTPPISCRTT
jgi:hypothetical protein